MKLESLHDHSLPTGVLALSASPAGDRLWAACMDGFVWEVETSTGKKRRFAEGHGSYASGCALLPGGATLVSAGYDGCLLWHDTASGKCFRRVQAHDFWSWELALSPDGSRLASVTGQFLAGSLKYEPAPSATPTVRVFDAVTGDALAAFDQTPPVLSAAWHPDGRHLATANMMGDFRVWDTAAGNREPAAQWSTPDFTSWGIIKSHHYLGGVHGLEFAPDGASLLGCGMGPMNDPMAGNGKMTWQRWDWRAAPPKQLAAIHDGQHGSGLMESLAFHPDGTCFVMAGRQAQGTWNAAVFSAADGALVHSVDTKKRITQARFLEGGAKLVLAGAAGQPGRDKDGKWPDYGRIRVFTVAA